MLRKIRVVGLIVALSIIVMPGLAAADLLQSTHFRLDPNVADTFGGDTSSTSYKLTDAGGETAVGAGSSASYALTEGYVSQLTHSIQVSAMPNGTAAYYPLDTGSGAQIYDVSANNNTGVATASPSWTTGQVSQALALNGSSQYASVPSSATLNQASNLTIEAWVNLTDYTNYNSIATKTTGNGTANNTYELRTEQTTGKLQFLGFDSALRTITSTSAVPSGSWVHVAVTKGGGTATLYINGNPAGSGSVSTTNTNSNPLRLGTRDDLTNFFKGSLDEVRLYSRTLSAAEINGDYTAGLSSIRFAQILPNVTPGASQTYSTDVVVRTDAPGYDLYIQANHLLQHTDTVTTIPAIGATIASPASWTEGTTKGLGFTVTSGTQVEAKWGTGPYNYAGVPLSSTAFHSRTGFTGGIPEPTTLQFRADTSNTQKSGTYSATITYTATLKP